MNTSDIIFPAFTTPCRDILVFKQSGTLFSLLLKDKSVIHFETDDKEGFRTWLTGNKVREAVPYQEMRNKPVL